MSWTVSDAADYNGFPADKRKTGGWKAAALISCIEIVERLSTLGIAVNLVTYLIKTMHLPNATSATIVSNYMGTSLLFSLLGGFFADTFLGRFKTIAIFSFVQITGTITLSLSTALPQLQPPPCHTASCKPATGLPMGILYLALYLIALGTGGLKSGVSGFGSDQFDLNDDKEKVQMTYFFNRFYIFISMGGLMGVTVLIYIQDNVGRSWGYGICSVLMFSAAMVLLLGRKKYRYKINAGSPIVPILQVFRASMRKRKMKLSHHVGLLYEPTPQDSRIQHTDQFFCLDKAAIVTEGDYDKDGTVSAPDPWKLCSVTRVEEVKMVLRLWPIWATTIIFWTVYSQILTFSVVQATTMNRSLGNFQIPAGSFTAFFVVAKLVMLAVNDRVIMPLWKKWKGKPGFTSLQRIAIGLFLSILGMAAAALAENKRLSVAKSMPANVTLLPLTVLPISGYYLIPQFILVGAGEGFVYTGELDFFITQSPKGMKTMSTGLFLSTLSFGFFLSSVLVSIVKRVTGSGTRQVWLADNINYGRLDYFYVMMAVLCAVNFVIFLGCAVWLKPVNPKPDLKTESDEESR